MKNRLFLTVVGLVIVTVIVLFSKHPTTEHPRQVCDHCGSTYIVITDDPVPPNVEWCINCGSVCEEGFELYLKLLKEKDNILQNTIKMTAHCEDCFGCRASFFTPQQWKDRNHVD